MKNFPIRYVSEDKVKHALKIDSFRNLSKDKIMRFASMIPYMDRDVAIAIINQFPRFADFGKTAISVYTRICDNILERNRESQMAAIQCYQTTLDALSQRMSAENISQEERKSITEDMILVADKVAELDFQNKKFLERMATVVSGLIIVVVLATTAAVGVNASYGNGWGLPQIEDNDDTDDDNFDEDWE